MKFHLTSWDYFTQCNIRIITCLFFGPPEKIKNAAGFREASQVRLGHRCCEKTAGDCRSFRAMVFSLEWYADEAGVGWHRIFEDPDLPLQIYIESRCFLKDVLGLTVDGKYAGSKISDQNVYTHPDSSHQLMQEFDIQHVSSICHPLTSIFSIHFFGFIHSMLDILD